MIQWLNLSIAINDPVILRLQLSTAISDPVTAAKHGHYPATTVQHSDHSCLAVITAIELIQRLELSTAINDPVTN